MFPNNTSTLFGKDKYLTAAVLQSVDSVESRRFIIINLAVYTTPLFAERTIRDSSSTLESRFLDQSRYERYFLHPADPSAFNDTSQGDQYSRLWFIGEFPTKRDSPVC